MNFEVTKSEKIINDRKNIILGINLLKFYPKKNFKFPDNSVIINFEAFEHKEFFDNYTVNFLKNYEVWDFNFFNAEKINNQYGTKIKKVLPMGYCQELKKFSYLSTKKDIDVLFMGSLSARRNKVLSNLLKMGLNVKHIFGIYGDQKDFFIKRAHLHLNIHYYGPRVLEPFRINYYLINGCPIISEPSSDN